MDHVFLGSEARNESERHVSLKQKWKPITTVSDNDNNSGSFDCNICLDSAHDPVVTLCGHLYCWPCIYKWIQVQKPAQESDQQQKCPVCKSNISKSSLVPLYGRGSFHYEPESKKHHLLLDRPVIPRRPQPSHELHRNYFQSSSQSLHHPQHFPQRHSGYATNAHSGLLNPTTGMFGEMVFARIFGNSDARFLPFPYSNSYPVTVNSSSRMRRQEIELDKSLNRVSIFFFCCLVLCLLLF